MKIRIEAARGELREKGAALVKAVAAHLQEEDAILADALLAVAAQHEDIAKAKSGSLVPQIGAAQSIMGNRAVHSGAAGLNVLIGAPTQFKPETDSGIGKEMLEGTLQTEEELAYRWQSMKQRKAGLSLMFGSPVAPNEAAKEVSDFEGRAEAEEEAREEAPRRRKELAAHAAQVHGTPVKELYGLMLPANKPSVASYRGPIAQAPNVVSKGTAELTLGESAGAPKPAHDGPIATGHSHTVRKRGIGEVTLEVQDDTYLIHMDGFDAQEFASLSAACDHVWAKQKGYEDASDYKQQNDKNKVPSGAGWKFWGLKGNA